EDVASTVSTLLNATANGAGTASFVTLQSFATGANPVSVAVADFNGDGRPDVAAANNTDGTVTLLRNATAAGASSVSFVTEASAPATGVASNSVAVGDFNTDGRPDLTIANHAITPNNAVSVILNTSDTPTIVDNLATGTIIEVGTPPKVSFTVAGESLD